MIERVGAGAMGEVFLAEHTSIRTRVAIKLLRTSISSDQQLVERFFNEAVAVGRIRHAGCVKIFDVGFHQGRAFLIMELLEGESLRARLERVRRMPAIEVAEIGKQIASVLDATHAAGITHRDLKPDNIFLVVDHELPRGERVKILDFGIAKLADATHGFTALSGPMGTPAYMAPEQWKNTSTVDWRADAYSLGCVIYEMAAGQLPFEASSVPEMYKKHLQDRPERLRVLAPEQPAMLEVLVAWLLAKAPGDRPSSMREIAAAFDRIATGGDAAPMPESVVASQRTKRPARRWKLAAGVGAACLGAVAIATLWTRRSDVTLHVSAVAQVPIREVSAPLPAPPIAAPAQVTVNVQPPKPVVVERRPAKTVARAPHVIDPFANMPKRAHDDELIDPTDEDPEVVARAHARRGVALFERGAYAKAISELRAGYAQLPLPGFLYDIGASYDALHERANALVHYRRYVQAVARGHAVADARRRIDELTN